MTHSPRSILAPNGSISPPHHARRSPGFTSTCLLHKHFGQWSVYPFPRTKDWHRLHTKSSLVRWNFRSFIKMFQNRPRAEVSFGFLLCCAGRENRTPDSSLARTYSTTKPYPLSNVAYHNFVKAKTPRIFKKFAFLRQSPCGGVAVDNSVDMCIKDTVLS